MKRFTETNKWDDPWYRKLTPQAKHLLNYLRDKCDSSGVVEIDFVAISFHVGEPIQEHHLTELESRLQHMPNGKVLMPKFVSFQYGVLSDACPAHRPILKLVNVHGLDRVGLEYRYPMPYPSATLALPIETSTKIPIGYPSARVQEKEKEKEKEKEEGVQGESADPSKTSFDYPAMLLSAVGELYGRKVGCRPTYAEESASATVVRREEWESELQMLVQWMRSTKAEDRRFLPQSVESLLGDWTKHLDRAHGSKATPVKRWGTKGFA